MAISLFFCCSLTFCFTSGRLDQYLVGRHVTAYYCTVTPHSHLPLCVYRTFCCCGTYPEGTSWDGCLWYPLQCEQRCQRGVRLITLAVCHSLTLPPSLPPCCPPLLPSLPSHTHPPNLPLSLIVDSTLAAMSRTVEELWCSWVALPAHCYVYILPAGRELPGRPWPGAGAQLPVSLQGMLTSLTPVDKVRTQGSQSLLEC